MALEPPSGLLGFQKFAVANSAFVLGSARLPERKRRSTFSWSHVEFLIERSIVDRKPGFILVLRPIGRTRFRASGYPMSNESSVDADHFQWTTGGFTYFLHDKKIGDGSFGEVHKVFRFETVVDFP